MRAGACTKCCLVRGVAMHSLLQKMKTNAHGRDWIVGDVHGHFTRLQAALDARGFNPAQDRLFSVGDLVDRGPESDDVLQWLGQPWFHAVRGNHEEMAIDYAAGQAPAGWYAANGGAWNISNPESAQQDIKHAFLCLPVAIELETAQGMVGIVHADCPYRSWQEFARVLTAPDVPDSARLHAMQVAQWNRQRIDFGDNWPVHGVRAVVVGHTPLQHMRVLGNVHFIDTGGWLGRDFCILDAATLRPVSVV